MDYPAPSVPQRHLLPWTQPLPSAAAAWLVQAARWSGTGPLDLGRWWVVVPTRQSGRRLREALAVAAATRGQAAFPPVVLVPEAFPATVANLPRLATRQEMTLAWVQVLQRVDLNTLRHVLPHDPPQRDFGWAWALAGRLQKVQGTLAEAGLRFADVAAQPDLPESERWRELADLEAALDGVLATRDRVARAAAEKQGLEAVVRPPECDRLVVIGVPDPLPVAVAYWQRLGAVLPIDILIWADALAGFDPWGRPVAGAWATRPFNLPHLDQQVRLAANPAAQARRLAEVAAAHPAPDEWLTVTVIDPEIVGVAELELSDAGVPSYSPEGEPWQRSSLAELLAALRDLGSDNSVAAAATILRHPDVLRWLAANRSADGSSSPAGWSAETVLRRWDALLAEYFPVDFDHARAAAAQSPHLAKALNSIQAWRERLRQKPFPEGAIGIPAEIYGDRTLTGDSTLAEAAGRWVEVVEQVTAAQNFCPGLGAQDLWRLAVATFGEGGRFLPKPTGAVELGGWLELLWADAPRLLVLGANDGLVPEAVVGDAFLPEVLRERLGLKTNADRLARDAYVLAAASAMRRGGLDVEIQVGKHSAAGDPLRPSRLLLACADAELPGRVRHLFKPLEAQQANLPWRRAWQLRPRHLAAPSGVSVTALRDWLECPFRFYLRRVLRMEALELGKAELDARDFGTLMHAALQAMGEEATLRETMDEAVLRDGLLDVFERVARAKYGERPSLPLIIQLESARQRLRRAAVLEMREREAGWRIERVETAFDLPLGGLRVRGKIDRIDRHEDGRRRVLDYKTSDRPVAPLAAHVAAWREADTGRPEWLRVPGDGRAQRWVDLQLPLYRRALAAELGPDLPCAYFNLPKAVGEAGLVLWPDEMPELQAAAERCAEGVAAAIAAGEFWPPVEEAERAEDWATLFHHGVAASVAEDWIQAAEERA